MQFESEFLFLQF